MRFKLENKRLDIYIDLKNNGRFRFKTRKSPNEFGNSFATKTNKINNEVYLEWQIGYDIKVTDTNKNTILKNLKFTGANGKNKYPYELSELLYSLMTLNLITKKQLIDLVTEIKKYNDFIGNKKYLYVKDGEIISIPSTTTCSSATRSVSKIRHARRNSRSGPTPPSRRPSTSNMTESAFPSSSASISSK